MTWLFGLLEGFQQAQKRILNVDSDKQYILQLRY